MTCSIRKPIAEPVLALLVLGLTLLGGCAATSTPADVAAQACDAEVRAQLRGKPHNLDLKALAASMTTDSRGEQILKAPVLVNAGLADEATQNLECSVRLSEDETSAIVLTMRFIW